MAKPMQTELSYEEVLRYMNKRWKSGTQLGLERIRRLLADLDEPQKAQRYIHIAGTNGKGSTLTTLGSILAMAGHKVGLYTSPYLERFTDRIRILDGPKAVRRRCLSGDYGEIPRAEVARLFSEIFERGQKTSSGAELEASEFEVLTAAALLYFRRSACTVVLLETGLGGRLDATNVIDAPELALITALGYDHCEYLGESLAQIAAEKAAIIKPGTKAALLYDPYVAETAATEAAAALRVVEECCAACAVPLRVVGESEVCALESGEDGAGQSFSVSGFARPFFSPLLGRHQRLNIALAVRAALLFEPDLAESAALYEGVKLSAWPGRLERLAGEPPLWLDGAHNPQAARVLAEYLSGAFSGQRFVLLCGVLKDKAYDEMLRSVCAALTGRVAAVVCSQPGVERDLSAQALAEHCRGVWTGAEALVIISEPDVERALLLAENMAKAEGAALVGFGSLYLVGRLRALRKAAVKEKN